MAVSLAPGDACWALRPRWSAEHTATSLLGKAHLLFRTELVLTLVVSSKGGHGHRCRGLAAGRRLGTARTRGLAATRQGGYW